MGAFFNNLHIRKNETADVGSVKNEFTEYLKSKGYQLMENGDDADDTAYIYTSDNSDWITVFSDVLEIGDEQTFAEILHPFSKALNTDALAVASADSDFLFMNLINDGDGTDAWARVGSAAGTGIRRRSNLSAWKNKVSDFDAFKSAMKEQYVFAEESLKALEDGANLPVFQATACSEIADELAKEGELVTVYLKCPETEEKELPKFFYGISDCILDVDHQYKVSVLNKGGKSKGVEVVILGDFIKNNEITFSDTFLSYGKYEKRKDFAVTLERGKLPTGEDVLYAVCPDIPIQPKVPENLSWKKTSDLEWERSICFWFTPHGSKRKILDLGIVMMPLENPIDGQYLYRTWQWHGSKLACIESLNKLHKESNKHGANFELLDPNDYDL